MRLHRNYKSPLIVIITLVIIFSVGCGRSTSANGDDYYVITPPTQAAPDGEDQPEASQAPPEENPDAASARYQLDDPDIVELMQSRSHAIPLYEAAQLFYYLDKSFDKDNGAIWGIPLHAPIMFYDLETLELVANRPDPDGILEQVGGLYLGILPNDLMLFDGVVSYLNFGGERWIMSPWASVDGLNMSFELSTLSHKAFHWHQPAFLGELRLSDNSHMNEIEARISIRLEINALITALRRGGDAGLAAINDALAIRAERRRIFDRKAEENSFELIEGLAHYIEWSFELEREGNVLGTQLIDAYRMYTDGVVRGDNLERMYGYVSGSLYAFLLDEADPSWMQEVTGNSDLGTMLKDAIGITTLPQIDDIDLEQYGYTVIAAQERTWARERDSVIEQIKESLANDPLLKFSYDHVEIEGWTIHGQWFTFPNFGGVSRGNSQLIGNFGSLSVTNGDLILSDIEGAFMIVVFDIEIEDGWASGSNWVLELNDGFGVERDGKDFIVKRT